MSEKKRRQDGSPKYQSPEVRKVKRRSKEQYGPELTFEEARNISKIEDKHRKEEEKRKLYAYATRGGENDVIVNVYEDGRYIIQTGTSDLKEYLTTPDGRITNETRDEKELGPGIWFTFGITKCVGKECKCFQKVRNYP